MAFKLDPLPIIEDLERIDGPEGRVYKRGDKVYRSVTSVLSKLDKGWLEKWQASVGPERAEIIRKQALNKGTRVHGLCEAYLRNEPLPKENPIFMEDFLKAKRLLDRYVGDVRGVEHMLYSNDLLVAGTADLIAQWGEEPLKDRPLAIIDFKTSKRKLTIETLRKYFLQLSAYAIMVQELYKIAVPRLVIVSLESESPFPIQYAVRSGVYMEKAVQLFKGSIPKE